MSQCSSYIDTSRWTTPDFDPLTDGFPYETRGLTSLLKFYGQREYHQFLRIERFLFCCLIAREGISRILRQVEPSFWGESTFPISWLILPIVGKTRLPCLTVQAIYEGEVNVKR